MNKFEKYVACYAVIISVIAVTAMVFVILQYLGEVCK